MTVQRLLIRRGADLWEVLEPEQVYYLEAQDDETLIRRRDADPLVDTRSLSELAAALKPIGFQRIHRSYVVNLARVRQIRRREEGRDWEVRMDPPVNSLLPVSRGLLPELLAALGASDEAD